MVRSKMFAAVSLIGVLAMGAIAPIAAQADGFYGGGNQLQVQKNNWRNAEIGSAVVGLFGLATHQKGLAVVGALGTVISASQYEQDRHIQSERQNRDCDNRYQDNNRRDFGRPDFDRGDR